MASVDWEAVERSLWADHFVARVCFAQGGDRSFAEVVMDGRKAC
jgi:hypothetical protein